ncbi:hypothetical protein BDP27DRAFT_1365054 [Rhodocollybia butyracea]|uniref:Zinc finger double-stranded RNA binding domain-containing protein n=1 Tax=Rhodocollybia butyracea TaxID=206335 RepID=A0A9P5PPU6_9AGAR|nr:hypothetical protein BDP27DRAFT_1365054 [Rhodocollybia butyracea]
MADVRALLKAKRQEARITHPHASYSQSGQLKCTACSITIKHASAWEGHLGSKAHRTTVARLKEQQRAKEEQRLREEREEQERISRGKRKAEEEEEDIVMQAQEDTATKRPRLDAGFPADFFSDSSRALPLLDNVSDDENEGQPETSVPNAESTTTTPLDLEWERFQREVVNAPDFRETYEGATVFAEPVLASQVPEGFPALEAASEPQEASKLDEDEARRQKETDERELIMDRKIEEERAQEEADMKVVAMKTKLELLRKKREAAKTAKIKTTSS